MKSLFPLKTSLLFLFLLVTASQELKSQPPPNAYNLIVIGGGTSGTTAAIQAARSGVQVLLLAEEPWLGGMLTSAGVSAIDGNHRLPFGLWAEFRNELYHYYGGSDSVATGWVSNTLFEPSVGAKILEKMAHNPNLSIQYEHSVVDVQKLANGWEIEVVDLNTMQNHIFKAHILIDATEYGDILAKAGVPYSVGMDDPSVEEPWAPGMNDIIQDLTWVAILKDFGPGKDHTIERPKNYDPKEFACSCKNRFNPDGMDPQQMLNYAKLPNNKYLLNWPNCGNDAYLNSIELSSTERQKMLEEAKEQTLRFVYFIQHELGFEHLGLAVDEFPTGTGLALMPYHRESRRAETLVRLNVKDLAEPFQPERALYRTGIAVGDYPIDHHHKKNAEAPVIEFIDIKVPSYSVPLGSLIPKEVSGLIVAEKSIGVSNIVNGTTRLQPVVMGIGQAAGALAALAITEKKEIADISIRAVQQKLLESGVAILPYLDVPQKDPDFESIQRVGAMGWLRGTGISYKWANQTWFYPDEPMHRYQLVANMEEVFPKLSTKIDADGSAVTLPWLVNLIIEIHPKLTASTLQTWANEQGISKADALYRREVARMLDHYLKPFDYEIDYNGQFVGLSQEGGE